MAQQKPTPDTTATLFTSVSIIGFSVLVSLAILWASGGISYMFGSLYRFVPKFPTVRGASDVKDYNDLVGLLDSQPMLSFKSKNPYVLVETSDLDCINCARFHGYGASQQSTFSKVKADFIENGKMDYIFVDSQSLGEIVKHTALYCAGEQKPSAFFDYKEKEYQGYGNKFDIAKEKNTIKGMGLNAAKFEDCVNSKKYEDRVKKLTGATGSLMNIQATPTFLLYKIENQEVKKLDGKTEIKRLPTLVTTIRGNVDYESSIKPELSKYLK